MKATSGSISPMPPPRFRGARCWQFKPILSSLIVDQPDVLIARGSDGSLAVAGVTMPSRHTGNDTFSTWLLRQQAIVLRGGTLRWRDARHDAPELALQNIRLAILNNGYNHHLARAGPAGRQRAARPARFPRVLQTRAAVGNWQADQLDRSGVRVHRTGRPAHPRPLHGFPQIETFAGRIDNAIWIEFAQGRMTSASGELAGTDVSMRVRPTQPRLDVPVAQLRLEARAWPKRTTTRCN